MKGLANEISENRKTTPVRTVSRKESSQEILHESRGVPHGQSLGQVPHALYLSSISHLLYEKGFEGVSFLFHFLW